MSKILFALVASLFLVNCILPDFDENINTLEIKPLNDWELSNGRLKYVTVDHGGRIVGVNS